MNICFIDPVGSPYDGSTISKRALGGSESAVVCAARELVRLGHDVTVYNDCEGLDAKPGLYNGVHYRPHSSMEFHSDWYSVAIVSRSTRPFLSNIPANFKILWLHDTFCDGDEHLESFVVNSVIDEVWTLSDFHTTYISQCTHGHRRMMEVLKRKIWVTRNGVNVYQNGIDNMQFKDRKYFVFNAAVSKGMETLLEDVWPRVKTLIPEAVLTVIGGAYPFRSPDAQNDRLAELSKKHSGKNDVTFTGLLTQKQVANHVAPAGFMIYPQSFPETYGISIVEALVYGTPVISGRFGAMEETAIDDACYLMDYPVDSNTLYSFNREAHLEKFVDMVVQAYNDEYLWRQKCNAALRVREVCGWDKVVQQWEQHLYKKLGLYLSVEKYLSVQRINHRTHEIFNKRWSNPEEWAFYPEIEKKIQVVVPFYNASQYLKKCIESIQAQNYKNYHISLIDDCSTDNPLENVDFGGIAKERISYFSNLKRVGALANQAEACRYFANDDIIVLIDGDDALTNDPNIFKKINQLYYDGAEFTYGSCWSVVDNIPLIAQEYPPEVHNNKSYREHKFAWNMPYTHLRTFSGRLFHEIDKSLLKDDEGNYYKAGGDSALFYALIEKVDPSNIRVVRDVVYLYNDAHPNNDYKVNSEEQTKNAQEILKKMDKSVNRILIAIPTNKNIHPETFKSIYDLEIPDGCETTFQYFYGYNVDQVRNLIAHWAIQNKFTHVFCVDYDIAFSSDTLKKLLSHDKDIVTGLYIQRKSGSHILEIYRNDINGTQYNVPYKTLHMDLEGIDGCGLGCCLIKTKVFEAVGHKQFEYHDAIRIEDTISEDVDFCNKARAKGFEIWADTSVLCNHYGETVFTVD